MMKILMNKKYKQIGWLVTTRHTKNQFLTVDQVNPDLIPMMEKNGCSFIRIYGEE